MYGVCVDGGDFGGNNREVKRMRATKESEES